MANFEQYSINDAVDAAEAEGDFSGDEKELPKVVPIDLDFMAQVIINIVNNEDVLISILNLS